MDETVLRDLKTQTDGAAQARVLEYFEHLKSSEDGWQLCMRTLTSGATVDSHVKFFCFQVVEFFVKKSYPLASPQEQQMMRQFLSQWIQMQCMHQTTREQPFILNKAAQIFCLVFLQDFPARWPSYFSDLLQTLPMGTPAVDMYLRVLRAIDCEVADREFLRSQKELARNTRIKDTIREQSVQSLVESWYHILTTYESSEPDLVCQCLKVIGAFVSWIDINLVANERFVPILVRLVSQHATREASADCIHDVISKGMDPVAKTKLVESFAAILEAAGALKLVEDDHTEFMVKLSRLINGMGVNLIDSYNKTLKSGRKEDAAAIYEAVVHKVALMMEFLSSEYDDVSAAVLDFAKDYIHLLKGKTFLSAVQKQHVEGILGILIKKMKYDESYNFEREGEDEALFADYRKQLKVLFDNVAVVDKALVVAQVQHFVTATLHQWHGMTFQDVEAAITFLYLLGEVVPSGEESNQSAMRLLLTSGVSGHGHPAVSMQFFRTVTRYDKIFNREPELIAGVLVAFLDHRGMRHPSPAVRGSCVYHFCRFVKSVRCHMQPYIEDVLRRLQDLLVPLPPDGAESEAALLTPDDQNFLYEAAGILIISGSFEAQRKESLMRSLLAPLLGRFESVTLQMVSESDPARQERMAQSLSQAMSFTSRTSKAFSNQQTMKACSCVQIYLDALQIFIRCLQLSNHNSILQAGLRQYLHRMVVCLEEELLPYIPPVSECLLQTSDTRSIQEYIPLINQIIGKFKKEVVPFLQRVFVPVAARISAALQVPSDDNDEEARQEKQGLQRSYYQFVGAIVGNGISEVLTAQDSAALEQILVSVVQGAVEFQDPTSQKNCYSILRRLVELWGAPPNTSDTPPPPPGFTTFVYKQVVPACFIGPAKPMFDLTDAQTLLALAESGACMRAVYQRNGDELVAYLKGEVFPNTLRLPPSMAEEYCHALAGDARVFKAYLKIFFQKAKS